MCLYCPRQHRSLGMQDVGPTSYVLQLAGCVIVPYMQKQCSNTIQFAVKFTVCEIWKQYLSKTTTPRTIREQYSRFTGSNPKTAPNMHRCAVCCTSHIPASHITHRLAIKPRTIPHTLPPRRLAPCTSQFTPDVRMFQHVKCGCRCS